jgi:tetratricopeptide (TPR) repeat protein
MRLKTLIPAVMGLFCALAVGQAAPQNLPLSTASAPAKASFQRGMVLLENLRTDEALAAFKQSARHDPNLALAQLFISYSTKDPAEDAAARARAKTLAAKASPGEQLEIQWLTGIRENDFVAAIAAMNDLLAQYPRDKQLHFLAGRWLVLQEEYEPGERMLEKALAVDPDYPAALNEIGYAYAYTRDFDKAFAAMEHYVKLLPREPNTQDSFGEISRMGGRFQASLDHYHAALQLDPKFFSSQLGVGDTLAVMGEADKARVEYNKAAQMATTPSDAVDATTQWAISYVREKQFAQADMAMNRAAEKAHQAGLGQKEAAAHRMMAMYQEKPEDQLKHLEEAEAALAEKQHGIAASDVELERARILRWKASPSLLVLKNGKDITSKALAELEKMSAGSRDIGVQRQYHAAMGIMLAHEGKFAEAIPHLEEDATSPFSQLVLLNAYQQAGDRSSAAALQKRLIGWNEPTLEQALVVPGFRVAVAKMAE